MQPTKSWWEKYNAKGDRSIVVAIANKFSSLYVLGLGMGQMAPLELPQVS